MSPNLGSAARYADLRQPVGGLGTRKPSACLLDPEAYGLSSVPTALGRSLSDGLLNLVERKTRRCRQSADDAVPGVFGDLGELFVAQLAGSVSVVAADVNSDSGDLGHDSALSSR